MAYQCPYCQSTSIPRTESNVSAAGWVLFVILLFACLPLCWLPFVVQGLKEETKKCTNCGSKVG